MTEKPPSDRERRFVAAWCGPAKGSNVEAARAAGYSGNAKVLGITAVRLLARNSVQRAIAEFREKTTAADVAESHEVQAFATSVMRGETEETTVTVNKHGEFVENVAPPRIKDRLTAAFGLAKIRGYEAASKVELSGAVGIVPLNADQDSALAQWMLVRDDPRVRAIIAEYEAQS